MEEENFEGLSKFNLDTLKIYFQYNYYYVVLLFFTNFLYLLIFNEYLAFT